MRIGCLQFDPQVGEVEDNLTQADAILDNTAFDKLDLLVLPELAFSGYNFKSLEDISPFLEEERAGVSSLWARSTALKQDCTVIVGYPEKVASAPHEPATGKIFNSAIIYDDEGDAIGNYRKTHLYYTDETWAQEGPGFFQGPLAGQGMATLGICMDLNPYKFQAPWKNFEFAQHAVDARARLVILSMSWLTSEDPRAFNETPFKPDTETLFYWVSRLEPIIGMDSGEEVIVVFANRCGAEGEVTYAGTSAVIGIQSGQVHIYGILGRASKELLVVDTDAAPLAKLSYGPVRVDANAADAATDRDHRDGTKNQQGKDPAPPKEVEKADSGKKRASESAENPRDCDSSRSRSRHADDRYMLQRYLESDFTFSKGLSVPVSLENSLRHLELTNAFAKISAPRRLASAASEEWRVRRVGAAQDDVPKATYRLMAPEELDRMSVRSDVSVWNNQPGRVPNIISPLPAMRGAQHQRVKQSSR